jgi:hypothetical protein
MRRTMFALAAGLCGMQARAGTTTETVNFYLASNGGTGATPYSGLVDMTQNFIAICDSRRGRAYRIEEDVCGRIRILTAGRGI